ncbi:hypothetical protein ACTFIY_010333 [Dictyostelium cf. discoideum]
MGKKNKTSIILILLLSIVLSGVNSGFSINIKSKGAEEIANSINKFSDVLPASINIISNKISKLLLFASDSLSDPINFNYRNAIGELFSVLDEANWKIDQNIKEIGYQKDETIEQLKELIDILKESLVDHHGQTLDLLDKRFERGISNALKKLEALKDSSNGVLKEIGEGAHNFLNGLDYYIKVFSFVPFLVLVFLLNDFKKYFGCFMIGSSVFIYGVCLWFYSNGNIYLLFIISLLPTLGYSFYKSFPRVFSKKKITFMVLAIAILAGYANVYHPTFIYKVQNFIDVVTGEKESIQSVVCPIPAFHFIDLDANDNIFVTDIGNRVFKNLQAPLFIHSEIGEFNTFKSSRMTTYKMLMLKDEILDSCEVDSFTIRNNGSECEYGSKTCTKGVWVMAIKISDIDLNKLAPDVRKSVLEKDPKGTILFVDSEGTGDSASGTEKNFLNQIQIAVNSISSSTAFVLQSKVTDSTINELGLLAAFYKSVSNYNDAYDHCNDEKLSKSVSYTAPLLNIIVADGKSLRYELGVGNYRSDQETINLDNSKSFKDFLNYKGSNKNLIHSIQEIVDLWGSKIKSTVVLGASAKETEIFDNLMENNIPKNWEKDNEAATLYSYKYHTLPRIFSTLLSKKVSGREANGQDILDIIDVTKKLLNGIPPNLFNSLNAQSFSGLICETITNITNSWTNLAHSSIRVKFPIESTGGKCFESSNPIQRCSESSFNNEWEKEVKSLNIAICIVSHSASDKSAKDQCIKNVFSTIVEPSRKQSFKENQETCKFKWMTTDWSGCHGACPLSRNRQVYCALEKLPYRRRDGCCEDVPNKPVEVESCNQFTYHWDIGQWSQCSGPCGLEYRSLYCKDCQGNIVNENHCLNQYEKPVQSRSCNPVYEWGATNWVQGSCRRRWFRRRRRLNLIVNLNNNNQYVVGGNTTFTCNSISDAILTIYQSKVNLFQYNVMITRLLPNSNNVLFDGSNGSNGGFINISPPIIGNDSNVQTNLTLSGLSLLLTINNFNFSNLQNTIFSVNQLATFATKYPTNRLVISNSNFKDGSFNNLISNSTFLNCSNSFGFIYSSFSGVYSFTITGCTIYNSNSVFGGAIYATNTNTGRENSQGLISSTEFINNTASIDGGAVYLLNAPVLITSSNFTSGCIFYIQNSNDVTIQYSGIKTVGSNNDADGVILIIC